MENHGLGETITRNVKADIKLKLVVIELNANGGK
jgi:hypothetical protein